MAIKGGQILHVFGANFVIDRIQSAGVTGINVNEERLEELGNYQAIGTIRDIPDLTFEVESTDVTTEIESVLVGGTNIEATGFVFDLALFKPLDVLSPYKAAGVYDIIGGVIVPYLSAESVTYNFSLTDAATVNVGMRGDSIFYVPGSVFRQEFAGTGAVTSFTFTNGPALKSVIAGQDYYALSATLTLSSGQVKRLRLGDDYTNTTTGITMLVAPPASSKVHVVYGSAAATQYLQTVHSPPPAKPAGVRGRNVFVRLGTPGASPVWGSWLGVQSATAEWRVTLERDEEFGNPQAVAQDFETPEVDGSVTMRPVDVAAFISQVQKVANIPATEIANATQDPPQMNLQYKIVSPDTGTTTKTLWVPDAKFTVPAVQPQVGQKLEVEFPFTSASGSLDVVKGDPI